MIVQMSGWETMLAAVVVGLLLAAESHATPPQRLALLDGSMLVVRLPDGVLSGWFVSGPSGAQTVATRLSRDNGQTWGEPQTAFALPGGPGDWLGVEPLLDQAGEMQVFLLRWGQPGQVTAGEAERVLAGQLLDTRLDIWHARSREGRSRWEPPRMIWKGYTGALNSVVQMAGGRILLPFSYLTNRSWSHRGSGLDQWTFMGQYDCTLVYSDDAGESWSLADSVRTPVPDIVSAYGAVEPVVIQRRDGSVWMLIRTQQGRLYEAFSPDGRAWSVPRPTALLSSDSPVGIVRLQDQRLVLLWNNCLRFPYAYGGRHVLHAAISDDEGQSWRGFREVARDPRRHLPPPPGGDFGTAYPFPAVANDNKVIYCTGQGAGRVLLMRLDQQWLLERRQTARIRPDDEEWHRFGTKGVEVVPHPAARGTWVLSLRKPSADWPAATTWNFPAGRSGRMTLRLMPRPGAERLLLALTDHFSAPFDLEDEFHNLYNLYLGPGGIPLTPDRWHEVALEWQEASRTCAVSVDGRPAASLPLRRETLGACYLRLRCLADTTDEAGWLLAAVAVEVQ